MFIPYRHQLNPGILFFKNGFFWKGFKLNLGAFCQNLRITILVDSKFGKTHYSARGEVVFKSGVQLAPIWYLFQRLGGLTAVRKPGTTLTPILELDQDYMEKARSSGMLGDTYNPYSALEGAL